MRPLETDFLVWLSPYLNWLYDNVNGPLFWLIVFAIFIPGSIMMLVVERRKKK